MLKKKYLLTVTKIKIYLEINFENFKNSLLKPRVRDRDRQRDRLETKRKTLPLLAYSNLAL